ncbi:MAG: hypothetical protein WBI07_19215 [Mobilitalea sp.]
MDKETIIVMCVSLAIVMPVIYLIINWIDRKQKISSNSGAMLVRKKGKSSSSHQLYRLLCNFPITSGYMDKLRRQYEITCPSDPQTIISKTITLAVMLFVLDMIQFIIIFCARPSLYHLVLSGYLIVIVNNEIVSDIVIKAEITLHESMKDFLSDVGHNYHKNQMVDEAVLEAAQGNISRDMKTHAHKLYETIVSVNQKEDVIKYNSTTNNKFMKMFLALCINIMEYNDTDLSGNQLLSANIFHLKREIELEVLKMKKLRFVFSGSVFVSVVGCIFIKAIQNFGISIMPELKSFYLGQGGIIYVGLIILSSIIIYILISNAKEVKRSIPRDDRFIKRLDKNVLIKKALDNYIEKNYGKILRLKNILSSLGESVSPRLLIIKRMLAAVIIFAFSMGLILYIHYNNRKLLIQEVNNVENLTSASSEEQTQQIADAVLKYVKEYKESDITKDQILAKLNGESQIYNTIINEAIAAEVVERINRYQKEYFKWYEFMGCLLLAIFAYQLPYLIILYRKKLLIANMEDEVNQFNSIIYMLMYVEHITVMDLLEQMELFAVVFKSTLQQCMNDYNSGEVSALSKMIENENCAAFKRLTENLIQCDSMPIYEAFEEIASDRETQYEERKFENERMIQRRADNVKPLSFIPAILVMIYLILPIVMVGLQELISLREMITDLGF